MIFSRTVTASELRHNLRDNLELVKDDQVLQITHRGEPIRVMMTQELYFKLLGQVSALSPVLGSDRELAPRVSAAERKQKLRNRVDAESEKSRRGVG
jgi:hypothetical protein